MRWTGLGLVLLIGCRGAPAMPAGASVATAGSPTAAVPSPAAATPAEPAAEPTPAARELAPLEPEPAAGDDTGARFGDDGASQSQSLGTAQNGTLQAGVALQDTAALRVLPATRQRGFMHGTAELTHLLTEAAQAVAGEFPGSVLEVGNLSRAGGGDIPPSVSHNSGRDADVSFYAFDRAHGRDASPGILHFDDQGLSDQGAAAGKWEFDTARNWALVRHLLGDPRVVVQWIFVSVPLRNRLLDYALRQGEPESLRRRARQVLVQPRDSSPHADHFHVRIACPEGDKPACIDGLGLLPEARAAQVDALLEMYEHGSPAEQRYARELLTLPPDGDAAELPPIEGTD